MEQGDWKLILLRRLRALRNQDTEVLMIGEQRCSPREMIAEVEGDTVVGREYVRLFQKSQEQQPVAGSADDSKDPWFGSMMGIACALVLVSGIISGAVLACSLNWPLAFVGLCAFGTVGTFVFWVSGPIFHRGHASLMIPVQLLFIVWLCFLVGSWAGASSMWFWKALILDGGFRG